MRNYDIIKLLENLGGEIHMAKKKTPQQMRESLKRDELKNNPGGTLRDGFDNGAGAAGDMGWKGMALLILVLVIGYIIYQLFF